MSVKKNQGDKEQAAERWIKEFKFLYSGKTDTGHSQLHETNEDWMQ